MSGVVLPLLALTAALAIGNGLVPVAAAAVEDGTGSAGRGGDRPATSPPSVRSAPAPGGSGARGFYAFALLTVAAAVLLAVGLGHIVAGKYSWLVGGVPRSGAPSHTFEALVRELGFGLFPWSAVAVFALARPLIRLDADGTQPGHRGPTRAWRSSSSTCCSSPAWATRCRATATSCSGRPATRRSPPSRWRSARSSTRRWRGCAPSPWPAC